MRNIKEEIKQIAEETKAIQKFNEEMEQELRELEAKELLIRWGFNGLSSN